MSCECDPIVVGEAGAQGPQGFRGLDGTNGANGINAFTTTSASFVQPSIGSSVAITVVANQWISVGQIIYISLAGYYQVSGLAGTTGVTATLVQSDGVSPTGTVPSGSKVSPSGNVLAAISLSSLSVSGDSSLNGALTVNDTGADKDTRIEGDTDQNLFFADASSDFVGIGTNTPATKLHVQGNARVTGTSDLRGAVTINEDASSSANVRIEGQSAPNLVFVNASTNRVGINTTSPNSLLDVSGGFQASTAVINQGGNSGAVFSVLGSGGATRLYSTDSAVGVGTITPSIIGVGVGETNLSVNGVCNTKKLSVTSGLVTSAVNGIYYGTYIFSGTFTVLPSTTSIVDVTVTGASVGDFVLVAPPSPSSIGFITDVGIQAVVSGANTVRVVFRNYSATVYTFASSSVLKVLAIGAQALP